MSEPIAVKHLIPPDLLATPDLLVAVTGRSEADAREIVELAYAEEDPGDLSVWGVVNGITSAAKAHRYAEARTHVSNLAGRVLSTTVK